MITLFKITQHTLFEFYTWHDIICEIFNELYTPIIKKEALEYILNFAEEPILKTRLKSDGFHAFVIREKNKIIGFIELQEKEEFINIERFYLFKKYRNKGFGKKAFLEIEKIFPNKQFNLYIDRKFEQSIEKFKKIGFEIIKPVTMYIGSDFYLNQYLMTRK